MNQEGKLTAYVCDQQGRDTVTRYMYLKDANTKEEKLFSVGPQETPSYGMKLRMGKFSLTITGTCHAARGIGQWKVLPMETSRKSIALCIALL